MNRGSRIQATLLIAALTAVGCGAAAQPTAQEQAQSYTQRFYDGDIEALHALFTPEMAQQIPLPKFEEMYRSVKEQLGAETEVVAETVEVKEPYHRYLRRARFERYAGEVEINWLLRDDHSIAGVVFRPVDAQPPQAGS